METIIGDYLGTTIDRDPFPHSLLSTRELSLQGLLAPAMPFVQLVRTLAAPWRNAGKACYGKRGPSAPQDPTVAHKPTF